MKRIFLISVLILIGFVLFFLNVNYQSNEYDFVTVESPSGDELNFKKAVTRDQIVKGLSHVEEMSGYDGMLFVLENPQRVSFWMNDMLFPLDIAYLDENKVVREIHSNLNPCEQGDVSFCQKYPSQNSDIKYAIELPAGSFDNYQIKINSIIKW
jgi:uncharacterized membrane protein (UPF0127 family)